MSISEPLEDTRKTPAPAHVRGPVWRYVMLTLRVLQVRLRFFAVLVVAFVVVGKWDVIRNYWDRLTRARIVESSHPASPDTEYYCPMCPGVASDWPGKCPVCNMSLVRHQRGEAVPLPDGVVARMQFSPYRLQLAGIKTSPVLYQPLSYEIAALGTVESASRLPPAGGASQVTVKVEIFEKDVGLIAEGSVAEVTSDAFAGREPFAGKVRALASQLDADTHMLAVWLGVQDPQRELRPAMSINARIKVTAGQFAVVTRSAAANWRNRTTLELVSATLANPGKPDVSTGIESLLRAGAEQAMLRCGMALALPESAVIDTGTRKVVYVENGPGMFDGVEVVVGPRCGDFYPVIRGLQPGQRVALAGAFLIDAETQLNRGVAATFFGAIRSSDNGASSPATAAAELEGLSALSAADRVLALKQGFCPVTKKPLGSMGTPTTIVIDGKTIFLCCAGCESALRKNPGKYLSHLHQH
ncbi:MAG TPA: efflux RND transporter periplasmic adaptor subunit [Gemmataceae bacterium]|nr:efflux RND transporter periplasmic adaptor subunit [Gemmataceae bacterium]